MTTLAVVGAATETIGQMQSAKAQQKAIDAQLATTQQEIRVAQTAELNERQRTARKEQARIKVAAGEAGLNIGGSVEALLRDSLMQNQLATERTNLNAESQQRAAAAEANSMSSRIQSPTILGAGLRITARPETLIDPSTYVWITDNIVEVPASEIAGPVVVGESYEFAFEFSTQYVRTQRGEGITTGRTTLRTFTVSFVETAYFKTSVAPYGVNPNVEEILPAKLSQFTGKTLGAASFRLNAPTYATGTHRFQVYGQNTTTRIRIVNDTYASSTFVAAEWEANYYNRSRT